jgi:hypothetical protein
MHKCKDITGNRYGKLIVIKRVKSDKQNNSRWLCQCDCGNTTITRKNALKSGQTKSCGCIHIKRSTIHGMSNTPTYRSWCHLKERCDNKSFKRFKDWGGRGITYDPRWNDFINFFNDMGEKPSGKSIDRINNDGNYCKENCRWATPKEQANNKREYKKHN